MIKFRLKVLSIFLSLIVSDIQCMKPLTNKFRSLHCTAARLLSGPRASCRLPRRTLVYQMHDFCPKKAGEKDTAVFEKLPDASIESAQAPHSVERGSLGCLRINFVRIKTPNKSDSFY